MSGYDWRLPLEAFTFKYPVGWKGHDEPMHSIFKNATGTYVFYKKETNSDWIKYGFMKDNEVEWRTGQIKFWIDYFDDNDNRQEIECDKSDPDDISIKADEIELIVEGKEFESIIFTLK